MILCKNQHQKSSRQNYSKNFSKPIDKSKSTWYNNIVAIAEHKFADIAQLVEHILGKDEVISSTLIISSSEDGSLDRPLLRFSCKEFRL